MKKILKLVCKLKRHESTLQQKKNQGLVEFEGDIQTILLELVWGCIRKGQDYKHEKEKSCLQSSNSLRSTCKNEFLISSYFKGQLNETVRDKMRQMVLGFMTRLNVSSKSMTGTCMKNLATIWALYLSIYSSIFLIFDLINPLRT